MKDKSDQVAESDTESEQGEIRKRVANSDLPLERLQR